MTATPADDLSLAAQVDSACDRFESEFRANQHPRLEAYLADVKEPSRSQLFRNLLEVELELRQSQGKSFSSEDYTIRFPEYRQIIDAAIQHAREIPGKRSSVIITGVETSRGPAAKKATPPAANVSLPLSKIGRFQVVTLLGEGAFGSVYKAHDPQLDREVAIKVPRSASHRSVEERERFLREGRAAAALHHPNICPVYEVGTTPEGRDYIVMAFIEGRPLSRVLQAPQRLSDRQIVNAVRRLALALEEAHAKGIIHRDLKPANIMINRKGEPVIMDFGLARRSTATDAQISHSGQIMGTPAYMSPEQARGDIKGVGPLSDLYSLGLVMYEMLCGRRPFEGTVTEVIGQILHVEPPPPSQFRKEIDPHLESICLKAIAKHPEDRFASMKDFATALSQYATSIGNTKPGIGSSPKDVLDSGDPLHTQQLAKLVAAVSSDVESKINRATGRLSGGGRPPIWVTLAGSGFMGLIVLLGILFFVRAGDTTILIQVPLPPGVDLEDTSLAFFLDEKPIAAEQIGQPIELTPGDHELVIRRGDEVVERMRFAVEKDGKNWNIARVETKNADPSLLTFPGPHALEFSGQESYVVVPGLNYDGSFPITVEAWVRMDQLHDSHVVYFPGPHAVVLNFAWNSLGFFHFDGPKGEHRHAGSQPEMGRWYHVAGVWDQKELRFYVDGRRHLIDHGGWNGEQPGETLYIGGEPLSVLPADRLFRGAIDEVRVSRIARYQDDFVPASRFESDEQTVALYHFDEGEGTVARDASGNDHDGRIVNAKWIPTRSPSENPGPASDWTDLFNGKDLAGWRNTGESSVVRGWTIKDGSIIRNRASPVDSGGREWQKNNLWTQGQYGDFVLELEFRGAGTNTLVIRADQPNDWFRDHGLHVPLNLPGTPGNYWLPGSFYPFQSPEHAPNIKSGWNHLRVTAAGPDVTVELNDETINVINLDRWAAAHAAKVDAHMRDILKNLARRGHIGFNAREGDIALRNIRIRELVPTKEGFDPLFNGNDLAGWRVSGPADWSVRDGAVYVDGSKAGVLTCERRFEDFELTGEVYATAKSNGGILFRVSSTAINGKLGLGGYEFQVAGSRGDPGKNYTGGLYEGGQAISRVNPPVARDSTWTPIRLRVERTHLQGWVDGRLTFDVQGKSDHMAGGILKLDSFAQGGEVGYRNFRIRPLADSAKSGPPSDARIFNGHAYKFFPEQLSWKEAKARCEAMGGRLAMVESLEENNFASELVAAAGKVDAWIGATDEFSEGQWRWVDGHLMTWTNWFQDQKQPNNKDGVEHFGLMSNQKLANGKTIGWQWSDQPNESTQHQPGFVCEWDTLPAVGQ